MSSYTATVAVDDGMLHTSRPLTAPDPVDDVINALFYAVQSNADSDVTSVAMTIETSGESQTPIGDSVAATSSQPLDAAPAVVDGTGAPVDPTATQA